MPLVVKDRVKETTNTVGTGSYTLAGAVTGFQSFSAVGDGNTTYYCVTNGVDWEVGVGTYTASGTSLSRDTILESSNSGSAVNWSAGTKDAFVTYPAERSVSGSAGALAIPDPSTSGNVLTSDGTSWTSAPPSGGSATLTIQNKTSAYTVVAGDLGTIINCTSGTFTVALDAAATLGSGFNCWIWNTSTSGVADAITIDPNGSETIDGRSTLVLQRGEGLQIVCDGTNWQTGDKKTMRGYAENLFPTVTRPTASGGSAVAIVDGAVASGSFSLAIGGSTTASSTSSTAIGRNSSSQASQAVTGAGAMALGGSYASGTDSFAAAVANNTSSFGAKGYNSIALGRFATATSAYAVAIGDICSATASNATAIGQGCSATASNAIALGTYASAAIIGKFAVSSDAFAAGGDSQTGVLVVRTETADATPTALTSDSNTASTNNQVILPNNSAYAFTGTVIARQQAAGGSDYAAWEIKGAIIRNANAASTSLGTYNINVLSKTAGASAWDVALSADTTNGGLAITVTGAAATNIRWVATVQTSEVTYA